MEAVGESRSKIVERVGGVPESGKEDDGRALSAEIEVMEPNVGRDADHRRGVMRRVSPGVGRGWSRLRGGAVRRDGRRRKDRCTVKDAYQISNHGTVFVVDISFTSRYKNSWLS
jgi:hypothetical protein